MTETDDNLLHINICYYEGESVSRPKMDIKHVIFEPGKKKLFLDISSTNICPIALPVCQNPQRISLLTAVSASSVPPFQAKHCL
jgi:hypothetical protein